MAKMIELDLVERLARAAAAIGQEIGLPYVAASADLSSPEPMVDAQGRPFAETVFRWLNPELEYWKDRGFALKAAFVHAARYMSEPIWFVDGRLGSWRPTHSLEAIDAAEAAREHGIASAIISPAYLPGGVIGAMVWATPDPQVDTLSLFNAHAERMHAATLRLMGAYHDARGKLPAADGAHLTRREIQCLKWAASGKTDADIGELVGISAPTVRFHLKNAAGKLHVVGRSQAVREAAALGYVGLASNPARHGPMR